MHEAKQHETNSFITLTYNEENMPWDGSLNKHHFQKFMKRLRKKLNGPIRFFHCGEYGEELGRPHYHACIFGENFPDKIRFKEHNGQMLYTSELLDSVWQKGYTTVGNLTFESAAYVARYCTKKVTGKAADEHYFKEIPYLDIQMEVEKEYVTMSRRPGIGYDHFAKYNDEIFAYDEIIVRGQPCQPPRYYDMLYEQINPTRMEEIKKDRIARAYSHAKDNTTSRLIAREKVKEAQNQSLKRVLK